MLVRIIISLSFFQDIQFLHEPKLVQILISIPENEIKYVLYLEIYIELIKKLNEEKEITLKHAKNDIILEIIYKIKFFYIKIK